MNETIPTNCPLFKLDDIDTLLWDWNGTLLDDVDINIRIINSMLSKRNLNQLDLVSYRDLFCFPIQTFHQRIGFNFEKESIENISEEYNTMYKLYEPDMKLSTNALFVLDAIREKGIKQYILSAAGKGDLIRMTGSFNLAKKFEAIYGADNICATGKVGIGKLLMQENQLNTSKTIIIGDTLHDAEVAKSLGIKFILYSGGHNSHKLLSKEARVISDLKEILFL